MFKAAGNSNEIEGAAQRDTLTMATKLKGTVNVWTRASLKFIAPAHIFFILTANENRPPGSCLPRLHQI